MSNPDPTPSEAAIQALTDTDDAMAAIRDHLTTAREQGVL